VCVGLRVKITHVNSKKSFDKDSHEKERTSERERDGKMSARKEYNTQWKTTTAVEIIVYE
jgi:hypothetical protein